MKFRVLCGFLFFVGLSPVHADDIETIAYQLRPQHWLWLERVARQDPGFVPEGFDPSGGDFQLSTSARELYKACGIAFSDSERIIYGPPTSQMIARLTIGNREAIEAIHRTVESWMKGRHHEWHHEAVSLRKRRD